MRIVAGNDRNVLDRIEDKGVCAAIFSPPMLPPWHEELGAAVTAGDFSIPRTFVEATNSEPLLACLRSVWPDRAVSARVRRLVEEDVRELIGHAERLGKQTTLRLRIFAEEPDRRFGYHVDVASSVPTRSFLRVYAGSGTQYIEPSDVTTTLAFYRHVEIREQLARELPENDERLAAFDEKPAFLKTSGCVRSTPPASIVAIEHVDGRCLRALDILEGRADGWFHRSPATGAARFVVTVTSKAAQS